MGGVEGPRDEAAQKRLAEGDQGLFVNRAVDVSHINLLRTAPSEHDLGGSHRKFEDGLDVQPSNIVDRLSPASCRRRPQTPEVTPAESPNPRRDVQPESRRTEAMLAGMAGEHTDLLVIGVLVVAILLLNSPTMIVGLVVAMCTGRNGPSSPKLDLHTVSVKKEPTSGSAATSTGSRKEIRMGMAAPIRRHRGLTDTRSCNSASRNSQLPVPQLFPAEVEMRSRLCVRDAEVGRSLLR